MSQLHAFPPGLVSSVKLDHTQGLAASRTCIQNDAGHKSVGSCSISNHYASLTRNCRLYGAHRCLFHAEVVSYPMSSGWKGMTRVRRDIDLVAPAKTIRTEQDLVH